MKKAISVLFGFGSLLAAQQMPYLSGGVVTTLPVHCNINGAGAPSFVFLLGGTTPTTCACTATDVWACTAAGTGVHAFGYSFNGGGSALTAGLTGYLTLPFACTISAWNISVDTGSATVDVWKVATGTAIPTVANTITASATPAISSGTAATWDANYGGVWHLPNGTTLTANDSTSNVNNGTVNSATAVTGQIDGGASFSSANINFGTNSSIRPPPFFLPVKVLGRVFRGKFVDGLKRAFHQNELEFRGSLQHLADPRAFRSFLRTLFRTDWVVYAKPPFGGAQHVLQYLARYTHRVAISNHRLLAFADGKVTFRWKDYAHGNKKRKMTLPADEFLRRHLAELYEVTTGNLNKAVARNRDRSPIGSGRCNPAQKMTSFQLQGSADMSLQIGNPPAHLPPRQFTASQPPGSGVSCRMRGVQGGQTKCVIIPFSQFQIVWPRRRKIW